MQSVNNSLRGHHSPPKHGPIERERERECLAFPSRPRGQSVSLAKGAIDRTNEWMNEKFHILGRQEVINRDADERKENADTDKTR